MAPRHAVGGALLCGGLIALALMYVGHTPVELLGWVPHKGALTLMEARQVVLPTM